MNKKILAIAVASAVLVSLPSAASAGPGGSPVVHAQKTAEVSSAAAAQNLFKAVYFGVGPDAQAFEVSLNDSAYSAFRAMVQEVGPDLEAVDAVIAKIDTASPGGLEKWHREVSSGDVLRVEAAFASGTKHLTAVVEADTKKEKQQALKIGDPETANPTAAVPVFVAWVAVVSVAGAVHALTAAVQNNVAWTQNAFWSVAAGSGTLESEKGIVELTDTLKGF